MKDYTTSLTHIKIMKHERLYNITHTNQSHTNHIKIKKHERLYNITHTNQSKGT